MARPIKRAQATFFIRDDDEFSDWRIDLVYEQFYFFNHEQLLRRQPPINVVLRRRAMAAMVAIARLADWA